MKLFTMSLILTLVPAVAFAHGVAPSPNCSKPYKPYNFNSQYEVSIFNDDVERYKECIEEFIEEQERHAKKHSQAAIDAIDEWNTFVSYELR